MNKITLTKKGKVAFSILFGLIVSLLVSLFFLFYQGESILETGQIDNQTYNDRIIYNKLAKLDTIIRPFEENSKEVDSKLEKEVKELFKKEKEQEIISESTKTETISNSDSSYKDNFENYIKQSTKDGKTLGIIEINPPEGLEINTGLQKQFEAIKDQLEFGSNLTDNKLIIVYYREKSKVTKETFLEYSTLKPSLEEMYNLGVEVFLIRESSKSPELNSIRYRVVKEGFVVESKSTKIDQDPIKITSIEEDTPTISGQTVEEGK